MRHLGVMRIPELDGRAVRRKEASLRARSEPIREDLGYPPSRLSETISTTAVPEQTLWAFFLLAVREKKETIE